MEHEHQACPAPPLFRSVEFQLKIAEATCGQRKVLLTELRRSVMRLILEAEGPVTAYQLLDRLKAIRKGAVPPTIYRALDFLIEQRLVHKVERLNAYIPCIDTDHDQHSAQFLICRNCGMVAEIEDAAVSLALARAANGRGFQTESAVVELAGTCSRCAGAKNFGC